MQDPKNSAITGWSLADEWVGLSAAELESRLAELPPERRDAVMTMLGQSHDAASFMDAPVYRLRLASSAEQVGPYLLQEELGQGGTSSVFRAVRADGLYANPVAVKVLHFASPREKEQLFRQEVHVLARLDHRGIVRLIDGGVTPEGLFYLVTEFVDGVPLHVAARQKTFSLRQKIELIAEATEAVAAAHRLGIVHRDLKPSNILVSPAGQPKLLDFGIARFTEETAAEINHPTVITRMTTDYASPEQLRRERPLTPASDVYSIGVLFHELLLGSRPPSYAGLPADGDPPPPRLRGLDSELVAVLQKALAFRRERRYPTAEEFSTDLRAWLQGQPVRARPLNPFQSVWRSVFRQRRRIALTAAGLVVGALTAGHWWKTNHERQLARMQALNMPELGKYSSKQVLENNFALHLLSLDRAEKLNGPLPELVCRRIGTYSRAAELMGFPGIASFGDIQRAARLYLHAMNLLEQAESAGVPPAALWPYNAMTRAGYGCTLLELGDTAKAEALLVGALERINTLEASGFRRHDLPPYKMDALMQLSRVYVRRNEHHRALQLRSTVVATIRRDPPPGWTPLMLAAMLAPYGWSQRATGDLHGALASYREAEALLRARRNDPERDDSLLDWLARNLYEQGRILADLGRFSDAREVLEESVARLDALLEQVPASGERRRWLALAEAQLASARYRLRLNDTRTLALARSARMHLAESMRSARDNVYLQEEARELETLLAPLPR